jgi:hypothetical protein
VLFPSFSATTPSDRSGPSPIYTANAANALSTLNPDNLSHWRAGGHRDWLREQAWLDEMRARLDFASDIVRQENGELLEAGSLRIAVVQLYTFLATFNPATLSKAIATQPGAYARILNVLCKMTDCAAKLERRRLEKERYTDKQRDWPPIPSSATPSLP